MRVAIAAVTALLCLTSAPQAETLQEYIANLKKTWSTPTEPFRIVGNVYYVGTAGLGTYLIASAQGHILIDTGLREGNALIKANIEKLGFKVTDIKQLLNTHAHYDHAAGLADLKKDTGAKLAASAGDKPLLEGGYYPGEQSDPTLKFPGVKVDRVIGEGAKFTSGETTLTALMTPGHSPGCTSWLMSLRENRREHTAILFCSATVAANRLVGRPTHKGIIADYRKTFARARTIKADIFLAPHPEMYQMQEKRAQIREGAPNRFVKDGEFTAYAADLERKFEDELKKQQAALRKRN